MAPGGSGDRFASYSRDEELRKVFEGLRENGKRVCVFMTGEDEVVPIGVEREALLARSKEAARGAAGERCEFVAMVRASCYGRGGAGTVVRGACWVFGRSLRSILRDVLDVTDEGCVDYLARRVLCEEIGTSGCSCYR